MKYYVTHDPDAWFYPWDVMRTREMEQYINYGYEVDVDTYIETKCIRSFKTKDEADRYCASKNDFINSVEAAERSVRS